MFVSLYMCVYLCECTYVCKCVRHCCVFTQADSVSSEVVLHKSNKMQTRLCRVKQGSAHND